MCVSDWLGACFDGDAHEITLRLDKVTELGLPDISFEVYSDGNIEVIATGVQDGTNDYVGRFVVGGLGADFDGDSDVIKLGIDEGIEIGFYIDIVRYASMERLGVLQQES